MFTTLQRVYGTDIIDAHPQRLIRSSSCAKQGLLMGCDGKRGRIHVDGGIHPKPSSKSSDGTTIQLILADDSSGHKRHRLDIGSSTTLKVLFN